MYKTVNTSDYNEMVEYVHWLESECCGGNKAAIRELEKAKKTLASLKKGLKKSHSRNSEYDYGF